MADEQEGDDLDAKYVKKEIQVLLYRLQRLPDAVRGRLQGELAQTLLDRPARIETPRGEIAFVTLGRVSAGRAESMLSKQPATIEWIDRFRPGSVFWDVGANVGVYTLYAALRNETSVVAFEPAAVNYFLLAANCEVNGVTPRVRCLLAGLGDSRGVADLAVSQFAAAQSFGFGDKKGAVFSGRQAAVIMSMDEAIGDYGLPCPNYIKIDVPERSIQILTGGSRILRRLEVREVHIEASESSSGGRQVIGLLEQYGFVRSAVDAHGSTDLTFARPGA